ncbi:Terpenoid synthase [Cordyceps fumosorosea ARSEF 2679]|uniref:Terpenoid synthase n=1 Tax=Cordyceps fumosorosea (strain ARSEF 2679) TaxID=1081104 RepID=A0A168DBC3_CORFA|nr:Terpenoid synthase [Cordyceps fumosorosea ARSEF 2679]OAA72393.1 Terpenoid synthase [Cordyceps fumosorosea ARSEF 2679]
MSTCQASFPSYVNKALFKNTKSSLALKFVSDWDVADCQSHAEDDTCMLYFPPDIELLYDDAIEATLARAMQSWSFFTLMPSKMAKLATEMSHFCALKAPLNYERRILLHHHLAWVFLMDEVVEKLPLHGLHDTAGKQFIEALKGVMVGEAVADLAEFKGSCPDELLRIAVLSQRILAEDLMPLKRRLLPAHHVRACTQALAQFFDFQYEEGKKFCDEHPSSEILQTRVVTVGGLVPMLLAMEPEQANLHTVEDAGLAQLSLLMTYMNDIIGLYKDLEAVERRDDGSAHLNLIS